jgi:hypothetical protein
MRSRKKKWLIILGVLAIIIAVLGALNPSEKKHREAVQSYTIKIHSDNLVPFAEATAGRLIYHNFIIFSATIDPGDKCFYGHPVRSIGFCGKVIVSQEPEGYG